MRIDSGKKGKGVLTLLEIGLALTAASCATLEAGFFVVRLDYDGSRVIEEEPQVQRYLESVMRSSEQFTMTAYTRRALAPHIKKTPALYHSFYVLKGGEDAYSTLSFSATGKWIYSRGAWALNTASDVKSYTSYQDGTNEWEVEELLLDRGIDVGLTVKNILVRLETSSITYYYNDHIVDKERMENCNSALINTMVERL